MTTSELKSLANKENLIGLGLVSGGLDSLIACLVLKLQGIKVIGLNFKSPFCVCDKAYSNAECGLNLFYEKLDIEIHTLVKGDDYLDVVKNPKFGYGKNLNPCIDCRIYILKKAKDFQKKIGADFIFTGEVLGQRPKSQNREALKTVEIESGLENELLRPLSAKLLKPTRLEEEGLISRSELLRIHGRSRKKQLELARQYNLLETYYACGGCLLTEENFAARVKDYLEYTEVLKMEDMRILKVGRHFRYKNTKIIVGRDERENNILTQIKADKDIIMEAKDTKGPITIIQGAINDDVLKMAAQLTLRYSDLKESQGQVCYSNDSNNLDKLLSEIDLEQEEFLNKYILR